MNKGGQYDDAVKVTRTEIARPKRQIDSDISLTLTEPGNGRKQVKLKGSCKRASSPQTKDKSGEGSNMHHPEYGHRCSHEIARYRYVKATCMRGAFQNWPGETCRSQWEGNRRR
jgi:hypothetical protein